MRESWASGSKVYEFSLRVEGEVLRVVLTARVGVFSGASLANQGREVVIELKKVDFEELTGLLATLEKPASLVKGVYPLPGNDDTLRILIQIVAPSEVLDETIVASSQEWSRWELVLGPSAGGETPIPVPAALSSIKQSPQEGRVDLILTGNSGLVAEVSFQDQPPQLWVDLPGVPHGELGAATQNFRMKDPLITGIVARPLTKSSSRLIVNLSETADLVVEAGALEGDVGRILIGLAPDAPPSSVQAGDMEPLERIAVDELVGRLTFALSGIVGGRTNAFTRDDPSQLVVDFLGWTPGRLESAAGSFTSGNPAVIAARVESTRLGSGRLVFELSGAAPLLSQSIDTIPAKDEGQSQKVLTLALRKPIDGEGGTARAGGLFASVPDQRQELHNRARPVVIIRPVKLKDEGYWVKNAPPTARVKEVVGLMGLLRKALANDPKYQSARSDFGANQEALPQARAEQLPTANLDYQHVGTYQNILRASNPSFSTGSSDYPSRNLTLTITQPIFKIPSLVKVNQASLAVEQAHINLVAAEQELILRLASSYLNLLAAKDAQDLARAEREATKKQFELAQARLESGLGTITQLHDMEARFALTEAREIEANNKFDDALQGIKEIVGADIGEIQGFRVDFDASPPQPASVDAWVQAALEQNLAVQSRSLALEIARLEIQRQQAGYLPSVNLVSTLSRQDSDGSLYGDGQKVDNMEVGVKLNVPIFEGGMTSSLVREALSRRDKASQENEQELRRTERAVRSIYHLVEVSTQTLAALRKAVVAQDGALQARLEGFKAGVGNIITVVDAYRLYYSAKRDYLQARYDYLVNRLRLKQTVGTLSRVDLEDLENLLKSKNN
ncbi:MAG: TolC family outer membrane protein [Magnetococcales bacterium]|nr:TolC family outer membrane protein [Magnetococcales bacterium]